MATDKPSALIIEDHIDLSFIFAEALDQAGYVTAIANDGQVALECLKTAAPTVILLDLHLPHVSGADILRYIRSEERLANTRVIIATANPGMAEPLIGKADLVLIKPISFAQLRNIARQIIAPEPEDEGVTLEITHMG